MPCWDGTYSPEFVVYGSAYNTDLVKVEELPDTLDGFSDPKWKDQLAVEARLSANWTASGARTVREGSALCQGIIYCGCGAGLPDEALPELPVRR